VAVLTILFFVRIVLFNHAPPFPLLFEGLLFFVPVLLNRFGRPLASRLALSIMPIVVLWYSFIGGMNAMPVIEVTVYDGLRLYLLAVGCIPFLILGRTNRTLLVIGTLPSVISVFFFEVILSAFDLRSIHAGGDY